MISKEDRYFIERKYHDPEKEFDAFRRMAYHGIGYIEERGLDDTEILEGLEKLSKDTENMPHSIARAMDSYFANKVKNVPNSRGGVYKAIFHSARAFIMQGDKTGARCLYFKSRRTVVRV